jgi:hypothetical protein
MRLRELFLDSPLSSSGAVGWPQRMNATERKKSVVAYRFLESWRVDGLTRPYFWEFGLERS